MENNSEIQENKLNVNISLAITLVTSSFAISILLWKFLAGTSAAENLMDSLFAISSLLLLSIVSVIDFTLLYNLLLILYYQTRLSKLGHDHLIKKINISYSRISDITFVFLGAFISIAITLIFAYIVYIIMSLINIDDVHLRNNTSMIIITILGSIIIVVLRDPFISFRQKNEWFFQLFKKRKNISRLKLAIFSFIMFCYYSISPILDNSYGPYTFKIIEQSNSVFRCHSDELISFKIILKGIRIDTYNLKVKLYNEKGKQINNNNGFILKNQEKDYIYNRKISDLEPGNYLFKIEAIGPQESLEKYSGVGTTDAYLAVIINNLLNNVILTRKYNFIITE
jgi:hypothetical protein